MQSLSSILTGIAVVWGDLTDQEQANLAKTIAGTNQYSKLQTIMAGCSEATAEGGSRSQTTPLPERLRRVCRQNGRHHAGQHERQIGSDAVRS